MTTNKSNLFMTLAYTIAQGSRDLHTKVGSVIVGRDQEIISMGWNGFPRGIDDSVEERYQRPLKYSYFVHSEINSILNAARIGVSCKGSTLYTTLFCCHNCATAIIQAGIVKVVYSERKDNWEESFKISEQILQEAGVVVEKWEGEFLEIDKPKL
jgi:dCMP deaminase